MACLESARTARGRIFERTGLKMRMLFGLMIGSETQILIALLHENAGSANTGSTPPNAVPRMWLLAMLFAMAA